MWGKWHKEVELLIEIMKQVIPITIKVQKSIDPTEFKQKADGSVVTICDYAVQAFIMHNISENLKGDYFLGEEEMSNISEDFLCDVQKILPSNINAIESISKSIHRIKPENHRVWVIDPIDGTEGFVQKSTFAIATCLLVDLKPKVSVTAWPLHDAKYTGIEMKGPLIFIAIENDRSYVVDLNNNIKIMPIIQMPEKVHLTNNVIGYRQNFIKKCLNIRKTISLFSMVKGFVLASGKANVYIRMHIVDENAWDIAPFELFLKNCGGIITLGNGKQIEYTQNGKIKGSANAGIVCTIGGVEWHRKVLKAYRNCIYVFALFKFFAYGVPLLIFLALIYYFYHLNL